MSTQGITGRVACNIQAVRVIFIEQDFRRSRTAFDSAAGERALQCLRVADIAYLPAAIKNAAQFSG